MSRLYAVQEPLLTVPNMPLGLTGFYTALSASDFKPKQRAEAQPRGGLGRLVGEAGIPQLPARRNLVCVPAPLLPLPGAGLRGCSLFISYLRTSQERSGARTWSTAPGLLLFPPTGLATPTSAAYPRGPRGPCSVASLGPGRPTLWPPRPQDPASVDPPSRPLYLRHFCRPPGPPWSPWSPFCHPSPPGPCLVPTLPPPGPRGSRLAPHPPPTPRRATPARRPPLLGVVAAGGGAARAPACVAGSPGSARPASLPGRRGRRRGGGSGGGGGGGGPLLLPPSPGLLPRRPPTRSLSRPLRRQQRPRAARPAPGGPEEVSRPRAPLARLAARGLSRRRARHALGQTKGLQGRPRRREPLGEGRPPVGRRG